MKFLLAVPVTVMLIVSTSADAQWDRDYRDYRSNNWNNNSYYDGVGNTSGDGSLDSDSDVQFNVQMRGDADGYITGNIRNGSETIYFDQYYNGSDSSYHRRNYRNDRRSYDYRPPYYAPRYPPAYESRPPAR